MKNLTIMNAVLACAAALAIATPPGTQATGTTLDDFKVSEGHFTREPTFSGSTYGILSTSTADRVTTDPKEGTGCEQLVLNADGSGAAAVIRFLSGSGTPANNTPIITSAGVDGWLGCYVKTTNTGWTVSIWIEQTTAGNNNAGVPKDLIADGQWHLYEWDLDNTAGDADGWGDIFGLGGGPVVADGSHTIDSIVLRNAALVDTSSLIFVDFVAQNDSGSVSNLLVNPCLSTPGVLVNGPISTNSNQVVVTGVTNTATKVTVY